MSSRCRSPCPSRHQHWGVANSGTVSPTTLRDRHLKPGTQVADDSICIGNLKGDSKVDQLTAVDTCTLWAMVWLIHGTINNDVSVALLEPNWTTWKQMGFPIEAIVADNGPPGDQLSAS